MKEMFEEMIQTFMDEMDKLLSGFKQCIFFLSIAYTEIFYGAHELDHSKTSHRCCHRYFPTDADRQHFEEAVQAVEAENDGLQKTYCSCSVIDLICQVDLVYSKNLRKKVAKQFI